MKPTKRQLIKLLPTEDAELKLLAVYLDRRFGYYGWVHPANERKCSPRYGTELTKKGVKAGFPDVLIFNSPPGPIETKGMAIELKRKMGGQVSDSQNDWLDALTRRRWICRVACGAAEAIKQIEEIYGVIND